MDEEKKDEILKSISALNPDCEIEIAKFLESFTLEEKEEISLSVAEEKLFVQCALLHQMKQKQRVGEENEKLAYARIGACAYQVFRLRNKLK